MKKVAVDLLYSEYGSFDKDSNDILSSVGKDKVMYLVGSNEYSIFKNIILLLHFIYKNGPCEFNILSGRFWHVLVLGLIGFNIKTYVVHFLPNQNKDFHCSCLQKFRSKIKIWVYSKSVNDELVDLGLKVSGVLTSRKIDTYKSTMLLNQKACRPKKKLFFPSPKTGVRQSLDVNNKINSLLDMSFEISDVYVQGKHLFDKAASNLHEVNMHFLNHGLSADDYDSILEDVDFVCVTFDPAYEPRASGILLDAIASGSIVITEEHVINTQYGFPSNIITNMVGLRDGSIDNRVLFGSILSTDAQFVRDWRNFFEIIT
jgi:hypothetical protein